jgi:hypothetical protein
MLWFYFGGHFVHLVPALPDAQHDAYIRMSSVYQFSSPA